MRVFVLFGGRSSEHEVSLRSAANVINGIDRAKHQVELIGIDRDGFWKYGGVAADQLTPEQLADTVTSGEILQILTGNHKEKFITPSQKRLSPDVIFPVLHGSFGEDGTMQGLLGILGIPYVGPDHEGSSIGMDKEVVKRLLAHENINTSPGITLRRGSESNLSDTEIIEKFGLPLFVKPSRQGSSVGVVKVTDAKDLPDAVTEAYKYDTKVLVEQAIVGRELEVAVLGNEIIETSVAGEILPSAEFYSYKEKYSDSSTTGLDAPAKISKEELARLQETARKTFQVLECEGLSRVDMFLTESGKIIVNEINTLPGFTSISMYPQLWDISGKPTPKLLDRLFELAVERYERIASLSIKPD